MTTTRQHTHTHTHTQRFRTLDRVHHFGIVGVHRNGNLGVVLLCGVDECVTARDLLAIKLARGGAFDGFQATQRHHAHATQASVEEDPVVVVVVVVVVVGAAVPHRLEPQVLEFVAFHQVVGGKLQIGREV